VVSATGLVLAQWVISPAELRRTSCLVKIAMRRGTETGVDQKKVVVGEVSERSCVLRDGLVQFSKFCLVGGSGVLVNLAVFNATLLALHGHRRGGGDYLANGLGFLVAVVSNYSLNRRWTFRSHGAVAGEFAKFLAVSVAAYVLNLGVFALFRGRLGLGPNPSQILAIAFVMPFNYVVNRLWSFRSAGKISA
jgi:putative flippase GtrA